MMIEKYGGFYSLQCDYCSNSVEYIDTFEEAVDYKKENGWKSVYLGDDCWADQCPNCRGDE